ncbi:MAG TPA: hypothetical protein VMH77_03235 [Steroidobacteraceae bacterium]|nr:hypothetical protein [Steroidobacteraceae bacterium]
MLFMVGLALASCATNPGATQSVSGGSGTPPAEAGYTARLSLEVVDQNGQDLGRATVELRGTGKSFYRDTSTTDGSGRVTFNGVPPQVEIYVTAQNGTGSQTVDVPPGGADLRMTIQTYGDTGQSPGAMPGTPGGAGGR